MQHHFYYRPTIVLYEIIGIYKNLLEVIIIVWIEKTKPLWLGLLLVIVLSNILLYQLGTSIIPTESQGVVLGSLIDLIIVAPLMLMLYRNRFSFKQVIVFAAAGCIAVRFIIPAHLLTPFVAVTWFGLAIEGALVLVELFIIVSFVRYLPKIRAYTQQSSLPTLFAFSDGLTLHVRNHPLIHVLCSELLMLYYAFLSFKKPIPQGITLHKKTSFVAFQIMMIHAIIIETIGIHYWLHDKAPVVSLLLLVFNIYSVLFFIADLQVMRLTPSVMKNNTLYISVGLMKRATIDVSNIAEIIEDPEMLQRKKTKDTIEFMARDFEKVYPDILLKMATPQKVTLAMGLEKHYDYIAIKTDDPQAFKAQLKKDHN